MYADVTDLLLAQQPVEAHSNAVRFTNPLVLAGLLRRLMLKATRCRATCGFGTNRLLTRLATKQAKPDGAAFFLDADWRLAGSKTALSDPSRLLELATPQGARYLSRLRINELPGKFFLTSIFAPKWLSF